MMGMRSKGAAPTAGSGTDPVECEVRPGGMLVQKRNAESDQAAAPTIRVRVKYGPSHHEIRISSQATFAPNVNLHPIEPRALHTLKGPSSELSGELKKLLASQTGLHPQDQKLFFKDKERDSRDFLDITGVKDKSKMVLQEDAQNQEKRYLEMRRSVKMEKAAKSITEVSLEVDKLAEQVSALESLISKGGKVAEKDVLGLIELLMTQLIKLDGIIVDGNMKMQRRIQMRRVQKYVETLDSIKVSNSMVPSSQAPAREPVVVTTKWETFDSSPAPPPIPSSSMPNWEFFD